jgi:hypothetical protein
MVCEGAPGQSCRPCQVAKGKCRFAAPVGRGVSKAKTTTKVVKLEVGPPPLRTHSRKRGRTATKPVVLSSTDEDDNGDNDDNDNDRGVGSSKRKTRRRLTIDLPAPKKHRSEGKGKGKETSRPTRGDVLLLLGEVHELHTKQAVAISKLAEMIRSSGL